MYGLPVDFDAGFFVGRTLEMICITAHQVFLHFDKTIRVAIESEYSLQTEASRRTPPLIPPELDPRLLQLIERKVTMATGDRAGTLTLAFDNGTILMCFDPSDQYESYTITRGKQTIIV